MVPIDTGAVASELQKTWNRKDAREWAEVYTRIFPPYRLLIECYAKTQEVLKNNELLARSAGRYPSNPEGVLLALPNER